METAAGTRELDRCLLVRLRQSCGAALPLCSVSEITRPLPVEKLAGTPAFVLGMTVVRGEPLPVVHLPGILGLNDGGGVGRLVIVRAGERHVALAVEAVHGISDVRERSLHASPPLLRDVLEDRVKALSTLDPDLLLVLRVGRLLPDEIWEAIDAGEVGAA